MSEHVILCQMMQRKEVYFGSGLRAEHFTVGPARRVYQAIGALYSEGNAPDAFVLQDVLDEHTYQWFTTNVVDAVPSWANWKYYRDSILADYRERKVREITMEASSRAGEDGVVDWLMRELAGIDGASDELVEQREFMREYVEHVEERYRNRGTLPGIETGMMQLDHYTLGLQPRRMIVVGARPSMGKTAVMTSLVANQARLGIRCGIVSVESSRHELTTRILANIESIDNTHLVSGLLTPAELKGLGDGSQRMSAEDWSVTICDNPYLSMDGIKARIREMVVSHECQVVYVDYIQRIRQTDHSIPFRLHMAQCSTDFKSLATELSVPIVVLAQVGRDAEGGRPRLSHLKETGQLEQDADTVIFIADVEGEIYLDVPKNRDGKKGMVPVTFQGEYMRFSGGRDE